MPTTEDELRELLDRQALYDLALRYARACDRRDYGAFEEIFTEDGRLSGHHGDPDTAPALYEMEGHAAIAQAMHGLERYRTTFHFVGNQLVEILGDGARGETYCMAHHVHQRDGVALNLTMAIRYQDRFWRGDGGWRIAERRLAIDWERELPLTLAAPGG